MAEDVTIRPYGPDDRDALADLWVAAWQVTMPTIDFSARRPWIRERLEACADTTTVTLVAQGADGRPVGFAMVEPARNWLEQLAVDPARFGEGAGRRLMSAVRALCPDSLSLRVNQDNPRAVRFYQRAGFAITAAGTNPGGSLKTWDMTWRAP